MFYFSEAELQSQTSLVIDHPLAPEAHQSSTATSGGGVDNLLPRDSQNNAINITGGDRGKEPQHGGCLTLSDHDRLRIFIHEFLVRGLIPWAEKTLKTLNEQVRMSVLSYVETNYAKFPRALFSCCCTCQNLFHD